MRSPIKLDIDRVPGFARRIVPCIHNPRKLAAGEVSTDEFSTYVSTLKFGRAWRSTSGGRHAASRQIVVELARTATDPVILDVGASDGSTSLDQIEALGETFRRYYVTDQITRVPVLHEDGVAWFYHPTSGECIVRASPAAVVYPETEQSLPPLAALSRRLLARAPRLETSRAEWVSLTRPEVVALAARDERVVLCEYDLFDPWPREPADVVKVANVLNADYFPSDRLREALANLAAATREGGHVLVVDNRGDLAHSPASGAGVAVERFSLFRKQPEGLVLLRESDAGTDASRAWAERTP